MTFNKMAMTRSKKQSRRIATEVMEKRPIDYIKLKNGSFRPQPKLTSFQSVDEELFFGHVFGPESELDHFEKFGLIKSRIVHQKISRDAISYKTKPSPIGSTYYNFSLYAGH